MINTNTTPQFFGTAIPAKPIVLNAPVCPHTDIAAPTRSRREGVCPEDTALRVVAVFCFAVAGGAVAFLIYSIGTLIGQLAAAVKMPGVSF